MTPNVIKRPEMQKTQYPKNDPPTFFLSPELFTMEKDMLGSNDSKWHETSRNGRKKNSEK